MNPSLKRNLLNLLANPLVKPFFWLACQGTGQRSIWLSFAKNHAELTFLKTQPEQPVVLAGPFAGLRYSVIQSVGSVLAPKILGTYEQELFPVWEHWKGRGYTDVLDIGCAEGFYAVGTARLWPQATIHAYDIDEKALSLCQSLAKANQVDPQVKAEGRCEPGTLLNFPFRGRALIISDCEGYEKELFTPETLLALASADIVIEVHTEAGHDFISHVEKWSSATHTMKRIHTEIRKAGSSTFLGAFSEYQQRLILSEARDGVFGTKPQEWLVLEAKN